MRQLKLCAAVAVLAVFLWWHEPAGHLPPMEDLELLAAPESVEFYAELDFYLWLSDLPDAG